METKIYLVRHGESLGNQARIMLGHTDRDLSPLGYRQAECTAKELSTVHFDAIYSSDLIRAYNTAKPHAILRDMEVVTCRDLREIYVGEWENMSVEQIISDYGELFTLGWRANFGIFTPPGGESAESARERFYNAVLDIAKRHEGGTVLITAHAAVIRLFFGKIRGIAPEELAAAFFYPSNASYSIAVFDGETMSAVSYSNDAHLADISTPFAP